MSNNKNIKNFLNYINNNEIIKKGSHALLYKILGSLFGYVFLIFVTRKYGAQIWGFFALSLAILNITSILSRLGVDVAVLKFISACKENLGAAKAIYKTGLSIIFPSAIFFSLLLYSFSDVIALNIFQKIYVSSYIKTISFGVLPFTIIYLNAQSFRGIKKISEYSFFQYTSKYLFSFVFLIILDYLFIQSTGNVILSFILSLYFIMFLSFFLIKKNFVSENITSPISKKKIIKTAFPMMLSTSILLLMTWIDTIILGMYTTEFNIGVYNVVIKLAFASGIILASLNSIVAPKISEAFNNGQIQQFRSIIKDSTKIIFYFTMPILLVIVLFPDFLLSFFGQEFILGKKALYIILIGQFINAICGSVGVIMQMTGKEKVFQNILFVALLINIALNFILIPKFAIEGAAIASAISLVFWNLITVYYVYREYNILTIFNFFK